MTRLAVCSCVVAVLGWAGPAFAFEPIAFTDIPDLVGKQVFAGTNIELGSTWAYAGEPLTLVAAPPRKREGTTTYEFVRVKTEDGQEADVALRFLSKAALRFNLRNPGTARQLVLALLSDAFELPAKMHEIRSKYQYHLDSSTQPDEYQQVESLEESFKFQRTLLHDLVYGALMSKDQVLRESTTKWLVAVSDDTILDWYVNGIKDKAIRTKLENADLALRILEGVSDLDFYIRQANQEKADKMWRRGLSDLPADKLEKLDSENLARLEKETQNYEKRLKDDFALAKKAKAKAQ